MQARAARFFGNSYGYAVFPTIGKAKLGIGGAYGEGRVDEQGKYLGDTKMMQLSIDFQAGGQGYSQIIFLQDNRATGRDIGERFWQHSAS